MVIYILQQQQKIVLLKLCTMLCLKNYAKPFNTVWNNTFYYINKTIVIIKLSIKWKWKYDKLKYINGYYIS